MVKSRFVGVGRVLFLGLALVSCRARESESQPTEATERKQSALVVSLFGASVTHATGSNAAAVGVGDLDGDGKSDIAVLTDFQSDPANDYMVNVFIQDTDGTLKPRVQYPVTGPSTRSLEVGDVNGDGRADVVVSSASASVQVLLQNASGTLDAPVVYPTPNAGQIEIGDFNGDGLMDVGSLAGGSLDIFLQTATGTLAPPVTYSVPSGGGMAAGDLNGDGRTDLAVVGPSTPTRTVSVLLQNADGTLAAPVSYSAATSDSLDGIAVGDSDGDGRADVLVDHAGSAPAIARLLQDAQGALAAPVAYPSGAAPEAIVVADMDGDGRKDVLVLHGGNLGVGVYRQTTSGDFKAWTSELAPPTREQLYGIPYSTFFGPQALAVGDVNGDGLRDAVVAGGSNGLVVLPHTTDLEPTVTVTAPAPGTYLTGQPLVISWTASSDAAAYYAMASFDGGATYNPIPGCYSTPLQTTQTCTWAQPGPAAASVRIRVTALDAARNEGYGETTISLAAPTLTVTAPASGATVYAGTSTTIGWTTNLPPATTMRIEVSRDNGSTYTTVASAAPNTGSYLWAVTGPSTTIGRVRVSANGPVTASGTSGLFVISPAPTLTVTAPAAGSSVFMGTSFSVTWTSQNLPPQATVRIEVSVNGGATYQSVASSVPATLGNVSVLATFPTTTNALVRVTANGAVPASGTSGLFSFLVPSLTVASPSANTRVFTGTSLPIAWTTNLPPSTTIKIELSRDNGSTYATLTPAAPNTGSFLWSVSGPDTIGALVRLTSNGSAVVLATSGTFEIATPAVTVSAPTPGATFFAGAPATVRWATNLRGVATALIELSRDGGASFETLATAAPNNESFTWIATGPDATALVRVTLNGPPVVSGMSPAFAIVSPSLTVSSPTAGTTAFAGTTLPITWTTNLPPFTTILIELSLDGGGTYATLAPSAPNTGSFGWPVSGADTAAARVRLTANGFPVASGTSGTFAIVTPAVAVTAPAPGSTFFAGTPATVAWSTNVPGIATALIELSRDGGASFETLAPAATNTGTFAWTVTGPSATALVRVTLNGSPLASGTSGAFGIVVPSFVVTAPAEGAAVTVGTAQTITWTDNLPADATLLLELTRDGGASFETLAAAAPNTGSFAWAVTGPSAAQARVRITSAAYPSAAGTSGAFAIVAPPPALSLTAPTAGASWVVGLPATIAWTHNLPAGPTVRIELSRDGGTTFTTLASAAPNTGSFALTVAGAISSTALVRVTWNGTPSVASTSGMFSIVKAAITVSGPAAGAAWPLGSAQTINWSSNLPATGTVRVELSRDSGTTYTTIAASAPNTGSFAWTATGPETTTAKVRVTANGSPTATGTSGKFSLVVPAVTVKSPNTLVNWNVGTTHALTWSHNVGAGALFTIEVSRDSGATWSVITTAAAGGATSGSYDWIVAAPRATTCRIRVTWNGDTTVRDASDVNFAIK